MLRVAEPLSDAAANSGADAGLRPALALVFPPFGPSGMPSLGLGLLQARVKQSGFRCDTLYWSFELLEGIAPDDCDWSLQDRLAAYDELTQRCWYPLNEWIFTPALYGERPDLAEAGLMMMAHGSVMGSTGLIDRSVVLDLHARSIALVAAFAEQLEPYDVIGISTTFYQNVPALALARHVKMRWPHKKVVLGGANVDGEMGPALFDLFPFLDFILQGEVDRGLVALLGSLDSTDAYAGIPGLLYRDADGTALTGPACQPELELATLPSPDYDDYVAAMDRLGIGGLRDLTLALETSRGCWWGAKSHCTFCGLNANGMGYRIKAADRAAAEIDALVDRFNPRFLFMTDNIIALPHFETLLPKLAARTSGPQLFYEVKSNLDRAKVRRLAEANVTAVQPGIESFSSAILRLMNKGVTAAQNVALLKYAREYAIRPAYNIIIGFPGEDTDDYIPVIEQMPNLYHLMPPSSAPFIEYHRFSPYHTDPAKFGITLEPNPHYRLLYPEAGDRLRDIAYTFVRSDVPDGVPPMPYFAALTDGLHKWIEAFDWRKPALTWERVGATIEIMDSRHDETFRTELHGFAASLLEWLDAPRSIPALMRDCESSAKIGEGDWLPATMRGERAIGFSSGDFAADPEACIDLLASAGLLFVDSNGGKEPIYVALPLHVRTPPMHIDWTHAHV